MGLREPLASMPGPWGNYRTAEVAALLAPLVPGTAAEDVAAYVVVIRKRDGSIGLARSIVPIGLTISTLADTISLIARQP